jgi:hypothetical protein
MIRRITWGLMLLLPLANSWAQSGQPRPSSAEEISGMYTFLQEGEFVQVNVDNDGRVTGFVSRYSDHEKAIFLDHFFDKASLRDHELDFTTKPVHGVWFDFKGAVGRGEGKTRADEGYYIIRGNLTQYTSDANKKVSAQTREVTFKSFPQDVNDEGPPPKR